MELRDYFPTTLHSDYIRCQGSNWVNLVQGPPYPSAIAPPQSVLFYFVLKELPFVCMICAILVSSRDPIGCRDPPQVSLCT